MRRIEETVRKKKDEFGLADWKIFVRLGCQDSGFIASCAASPEYEQATLRFDLAAMAGDGEIERCVTHEMLHIVTSPIEDVQNAVIKHFEGTELEDLFNELFRQSSERIVVNIERMLKNMKANYHAAPRKKRNRR